jgi:hypothetical protein
MQENEENVGFDFAALLFDLGEAQSKLTFTGLAFKSKSAIEVEGLSSFRRPYTGLVKGMLPANEVVLFIPGEPDGEKGWVVPWRYAHFEREWTPEQERRGEFYDSFAVHIPLETLTAQFEYLGIKALIVPRAERDLAARPRDMMSDGFAAQMRVLGKN